MDYVCAESADEEAGDAGADAGGIDGYRIGLGLEGAKDRVFGLFVCAGEFDASDIGVPSHFGWKLAGFLHYRIGLRGRDLRELGFGEQPSNGVKGFVGVLGSEDRALGSHVRELR